MNKMQITEEIYCWYNFALRQVPPFILINTSAQV